MTTPPKRRRRAPDASVDVPAPVAPPLPPPPGELFGSAQGSFPMPPDLKRGFQTIVVDLYAEGYDVLVEWRDIADSMTIKDALTPQRLQQEANDREAIAIRAHRLYIVAKVEVEAYLRSTMPTYGAIRQGATEALEILKATGKRSKQITDADVLSEAARKYPDEWHAICECRAQAEGMLKQIERLSDLARSRCFTVNKMMSPDTRGA